MLRVNISLFTAMLALGATSCSAAEKDRAQATPGKVIVLDEDASELREDFNRAKGSVRLVFVVDPICPTCLRGMADVDASLLAKTNDPRLQTFVVHVPMLGATAKSVPASMQLLHNRNVRHYWNPSGSFGYQLSAALQLKRGDKPVCGWDVWMIYAPDTVWQSSPPAPALFMHQLSELPKSQYLDADAFAAKAQALLNRLPAPRKAN